MAPSYPVGVHTRARWCRAQDTFGLEVPDTQAAALLGYAEQVEQLSEALHTRTDIGIATGTLIEGCGINRDQAFGFLVRNSQTRNIKVRLLAHDGTFESTRREDRRAKQWP